MAENWVRICAESDLEENWGEVSPLYKEVYDLTTGECVSDPSYSIKVYPVEVRDGDVYLKTA